MSYLHAPEGQAHAPLLWNSGHARYIVVGGGGAALLLAILSLRSLAYSAAGKQTT